MEIPTKLRLPPGKWLSQRRCWTSSTPGLSSSEPESLGVSPCDLIFPENHPEISAAQSLTWCSLHASCPQQQTGQFIDKTNHFAYNTNNTDGGAGSPVIQPEHQPTVCVSVLTSILFLQPGYCCLLWQLQQTVQSEPYCSCHSNRCNSFSLKDKHLSVTCMYCLHKNSI